MNSKCTRCQGSGKVNSDGKYIKGAKANNFEYYHTCSSCGHKTWTADPSYANKLHGCK